MLENEDNPENSVKVRDYKIGYKKPPPENQWKKGCQSPNPSGRPRGSKIRSFDLDRYLMQPVNIRSKNGTQKAVYLHALLQTMMQSALRGDAKHAKLVFDLARTRGLLEQPASNEPIEVTLKIPNPPKAWANLDAAEGKPEIPSADKLRDEDE